LAAFRARPKGRQVFSVRTTGEAQHENSTDSEPSMDSNAVDSRSSLPFPLPPELKELFQPKEMLPSEYPS